MSTKQKSTKRGEGLQEYAPGVAESPGRGNAVQTPIYNPQHTKTTATCTMNSPNVRFLYN